MTRFRDNLLIDFSVISLVLIVSIAVAISMILTSRINRDISLLQDHQAALSAGTLKPTDPFSIPNLTNDIKDLRWITYAAIGGGLVILYVGVVSIVSRGWRTIVRQRYEIQSTNSQLERQVQELHMEVTERKQAEGELAKRSVALEAANRGLEAFSYSVSHDLRALLRSIDGFSQALLEDYADSLDNQGRDYLQRVRGATQRMAELIDDLLLLSRVTRSEMRRAPVDLTQLAGSVAAELQRAEPERHVEFVTAEGLNVQGDARLLRVVLENLLGNAWKFTGNHPRAIIEVGVTEHEGNPAYFVRDDGAGFDMTYANKLFGAFQRLHAPTEFEGTGIGLATVERVIHRHGGRVWADGAVEQGATFYFTLA